MSNYAIPGKGLTLVPGTHYSDTDDLPSTGTLYIGTGGDLTCMLGEDNTTWHTFKNIPSGSDFPRKVRRIKSTTTATDLILDL